MIDNKTLKNLKIELDMRKVDLLDYQKDINDFIKKEAIKDDKWLTELLNHHLIHLDKVRFLVEKYEEYIKALEAREELEK